MSIEALRCDIHEKKLAIERLTPLMLMAMRDRFANTDGGAIPNSTGRRAWVPDETAGKGRIAEG